MSDFYYEYIRKKSPPKLFQKRPTAVASTSRALKIFGSSKVQERKKYFFLTLISFDLK